MDNAALVEEFAAMKDLFEEFMSKHIAEDEASAEDADASEGAEEEAAAEALEDATETEGVSGRRQYRPTDFNEADTEFTNAVATLRYDESRKDGSPWRLQLRGLYKRPERAPGTIYFVGWNRAARFMHMIALIYDLGINEDD